MSEQEQERMSLGHLLWNAYRQPTALLWKEMYQEQRDHCERAAQVVKAAVLAEQEEMTGPKGMAETNKRVYNAVSATVTNMLTCMPPEDRTVPDAMARHISRAVGAGVAEGLKAWEVTR